MRPKVPNAVKGSPPSYFCCGLCGYGVAGKAPVKCPNCLAEAERFQVVEGMTPDSLPKTGGRSLTWTKEALQRLEQVPLGFVRNLTRWRVEALTRGRGHSIVTPQVVQEKYDDWARRSKRAETSLVWAEEATERIMKIPEYIRGMVIQEIERHARAKGEGVITLEILEEGNAKWAMTMTFHSKDTAD